MLKDDEKFKINPISLKEYEMLDYFETLTRLQSAAIQKEDNRLRKSEVKFFALLCYLNYLGYDIENHKSLVKGLKDVNHEMKSTTVSQYKVRLSAKMWIMSGLNKLRIPPRFQIPEGPDPIFTLNLEMGKIDEHRNET